VAFVADIDDSVALSCAHLHFVVDLRDEWAHGIHRITPRVVCRFDHLWGRAMRRKHHGGPRRYFGDVVDEDDAHRLETLNDGLVVNDLVVAVDGCGKRPDHPRERFDRHFHTCTEAPWRGEEDAIDAMLHWLHPTKAE